MEEWNARLSAGMHLAPEDGACLMEAVSAVTGERWTDTPSSTHPLLAHLARLVNDAIGDETRDSLVAFIPDLVDTNRPDPLVAARIAFVCTNHAIAVHDGLRLRVLRHLASRRLQAPRGLRDGTLGHRLFVHGTARLAIGMSVARCAPAGDHHLVGLLEAATSVVRSSLRDEQVDQPVGAGRG
jgi:hypothetical protein